MSAFWRRLVAPPTAARTAPPRRPDHGPVLMGDLSTIRNGRPLLLDICPLPPEPRARR